MYCSTHTVNNILVDDKFRRLFIQTLKISVVVDPVKYACIVPTYTQAQFGGGGYSIDVH